MKNTSKPARSVLTGLAAASLGISALALGAGAAPADAATTAATTATGGGAYLAPYYTAGDLTGDKKITTADLDLVTAGLGTSKGDAGWAALAPADYDGNGTITITDLTSMSSRMLYDDGDFDLVEASALDMQKAMNAGVVTSVQLTQEYLNRIKAYDTAVLPASAPSGARALNSIITTAGQAALAAAAESDAYRAAHGGPRSMLDGIPVLLKDNYDTKDMPTSAGYGGWATNQTSDDATMVAGLRSSGAVVLGKASLDEFAYGFASEFTTLSTPGSSLLVASPYNTSKTAGGSSGGTGASIAANLGAIGFGTDTGGSIRNPSNYNELVGIRPTVGLTSRSGIVPLALTQDTGGPLARSVSDAAIALDQVAGTDAADPATATADSHLPASYTSYLDPTALKGKRIGYVTSMIGTNATDVRLFNQAVADLQAQGATVVPLTTTALDSTLAETSGSTNEFKHDLAQYIADHLDPANPFRTLTDIVNSNWLVPSRTSIYKSRDAVTTDQYNTWIGTHSTAIANGRAAATGLMDTNNLDALMYPTGTPYGTQGNNLRLSPNTGMPAITLPMGQAIASDGTTTGANVNLELLGRQWSEGPLIGMAYSYEQATEHRSAPAAYGALAGDVFKGTGSSETATAGDGTVSVDEPGKVSKGQTFTVTVDQSAKDDYGYELGVSFDPKKVAYVVGSATTSDSGYTKASASKGAVDVVHTKLGTSPAAKGKTQLATLTFKALKGGDPAVSVGSLTTVSTAGATTTTGVAGPVSTRTEVTVKPGRVTAFHKVAIKVVVSAADATPTGTVKLRLRGKVVRKRIALVRGIAAASVQVRGQGEAAITAVYVPDRPFTASRDRGTTRVTARR